MTNTRRRQARVNAESKCEAKMGKRRSCKAGPVDELDWKLEVDLRFALRPVSIVDWEWMTTKMMAAPRA